MRTLEIHPDFLIQPFNQGVKLLKPSKQSTTLPRVSDIFAMPLNSYFVEPGEVFIDANYMTRITNMPDNQGYYSDSDLKGTHFSNLFHKETVQRLTCTNNMVLQTNKRMTIIEEECLRLDDLGFIAISFKFPIYNSDNKIMGVFGMSVLSDNTKFKEVESLPVALERIIHSGLISNPKSNLLNLLPGNQINNVYFSEQEIKCIRMLITGKTTKLIAAQLNLSPRTVEHYLENIKRKLNVRTKSELIERIIQSI